MSENEEMKWRLSTETGQEEESVSKNDGEMSGKHETSNDCHFANSTQNFENNCFVA